MRVWAYLALAGLLAGAVWYQVALHKKAARVDQAEERAEVAEKRALDIADAATRAAAQERDIAAALSAFRDESAAQSQTFRDALMRAPLTREVIPNVDPKTGKCEPVRVRDPVRYRELFNSAVSGVTSP